MLLNLCKNPKRMGKGRRGTTRGVDGVSGCKTKKKKKISWDDNTQFETCHAFVSNLKKKI